MIRALAILVLSSCTALAAPVTIYWDAQVPGVGVRFRVFLGIDVIADVGTNSARIDLPDDRISAVTVQAYSMLGTAPMSEPLKLQPLTVETGETLRKWTRVGTVFREVKSFR